MTIHVIGAGSTAQSWDGNGYSIGCNDCERWGDRVEELILVNRPEKFTPERLEVICKSKAQVFSHKPADWILYFPNVKELPLSHFMGRVKTGQIYKSSTSPFIAISKAFEMGATEIVIWGVDFVNHGIFKPESSALKNELFNYERLIKGIEAHGIKVYLGASGSALEQFVSVKAL